MAQNDVKNPRVARYIIKGNPLALSRISCGTGQNWESQRIAVLVRKVTIESIHDQAPFFSGPLMINASFYLPILVNRHIIKSGNPHDQSPDLDNLIKFLVDIARGIIYKDNKSVARIIASKYYSTRPRTEMIVSELKDEMW